MTRSIVWFGYVETIGCQHFICGFPGGSVTLVLWKYASPWTLLITDMTGATWASWHLGSLATPLFVWQLFRLTARESLTHWGRVMHICVSILTIIGSDNGLSPGRRQAIIWTNAGILFIGPLEPNLSEILNEIYTFSFKKCIWKCRLGNGGHLVSVSMY